MTENFTLCVCVVLSAQDYSLPCLSSGAIKTTRVAHFYLLRPLESAKKRISENTLYCNINSVCCLYPIHSIFIITHASEMKVESSELHQRQSDAGNGMPQRGLE